MLALTCDVQPATAVGSSFVISVTPGNVSATNTVTGTVATPVGIPAGGYGPNGLPASTSGTTLVSAVGSNTGGNGSGTGDTTPGVPNTGVGSAAGLLALISIAGIIALFGAFYLGRTKRV
jgi:LPXTG-motif cell wall-anchored protein